MLNSGKAFTLPIALLTLVMLTGCRATTPVSSGRPIVFKYSDLRIRPVGFASDGTITYSGDAATDGNHATESSARVISVSPAENSPSISLENSTVKLEKLDEDGSSSGENISAFTIKYDEHRVLIPFEQGQEWKTF
jgi:ABC-type Na+ efflux pump permease subunit